MTTKTQKKNSGRSTAKTTGRKDTRTKTPASSKTTKLDLLVAHLKAPGGATLAELSEATGWQPDSVRGALAGALRRKGHVIRSEKENGVRSYGIDGPAT